MTLTSEKDKQADKLARDILILARDTLLVSLRFLDVAIHQLKLEPTDQIPGMAVDGRSLYYNSWHILDSYRQNKSNPARDYLHVIFHCIFNHPFVNKTVHQGCWDLACDIAAECAISDLDLNIVNNDRRPSLSRCDPIQKNHQFFYLWDGSIHRLDKIDQVAASVFKYHRCYRS